MGNATSTLVGKHQWTHSSSTYDISELDIRHLRASRIGHQHVHSVFIAYVLSVPVESAIIILLPAKTGVDGDVQASRCPIKARILFGLKSYVRLVASAVLQPSSLYTYVSLFVPAFTKSTHSRRGTWDIQYSSVAAVLSTAASGIGKRDGRCEEKR